MYTEEEINKAKEEIKNLPGRYISQNLQLTIDEGDHRVNEIIYGEVTNYANAHDLEIVQISPVSGMLPSVFVVIIFKKGSSYAV